MLDDAALDDLDFLQVSYCNLDNSRLSQPHSFYAKITNVQIPAKGCSMNCLSELRALSAVADDVFFSHVDAVHVLFGSLPS